MNEVRPDEAVAEENETEQDRPSAFNKRSVIFGIIGLLFTIFYTAINDIIFKQTSFVANHLPPGPIFLVICVAVIWNPMWFNRIFMGIMSVLLFVFWGYYFSSVWGHSFFFSWHVLFLAGVFFACNKHVFERLSRLMLLSGRELLVTLLIIFAGCWTAGASLNYHFSPTLVNMWSIYSNNPQMQSAQSIEYIPEHLWPAGGLKSIGDNDGEKLRVYDAFQTGSAMQGESGVPWDAWLLPVIGGWAPLFILVSICLVALSFLVHRQWSRHEQLAYPIAKIGSSLFERDPDRALPTLFYNNLFRIAIAIVLVFHGVRFLHVWWPSGFPNISTSMWFNFILDLFPILKKSGLFYVHSFNFYFCIVGISYFLSREVGLTVGIAPFLLAAFGTQVYLGTGSPLGSGDVSGMRVGAYLVYAVIILYTGKSYYYPLFLKAFFINPKTKYEEDGVLVARIFIVAFVSLVLVLWLSFGLDLDLAFLFSLLTILMFLVFTRIICETGMPYLQSSWEPSAILIKLFGVSSIGAAPVVLLYYISSVLLSDPKESLMPYVSNGLKMGEDNKIKLKKIFTVFIFVSVIAVFLSIGTRLYQQYTIGGHTMNYPWADQHVPKNVLVNSTRDLALLEDMGERYTPDAESRPGIIDRIANIKPDVSLLKYMFIGGIGVLLFSMLRFRYTWFPLHPVLFLVWGITPLSRTFYSFLIGWAIREAIVKFGGGKVYQDLKPFFIGLIVGELFMMALGMFVALLYFMFTGEEAPVFYFNLG